MSTIFEGMLCKGSHDSVRTTYQSLSSPLIMNIEPFSPSSVILYRSDPRQNALFSPELERLAEFMSTVMHLALVIRYDSSIGHRSSILYRDGQRIVAFDAEDELFVPLDEEGMPILSSERLRESELSEAEEYETVENAIELGLVQFGEGSWEQLLDFMDSR